MKKFIVNKCIAVVMVILCLNTTSAQTSYFAGVTSGTGNTGSYNTGVGGAVLSYSNSGGMNSAFGFNSLKNNTVGYFNNAVGAFALTKNTTGRSNHAVGAYALHSNESGEGNVALGCSTLYANINGSDNIGVGDKVLYRSVAGIANIGIGKLAMYYNTSGFYNISMGTSSLYTNSTGSCNISVGVNSMYNSQVGSYNTCIGYNAADGQASYTRCTFLGNGTDATFSGLTNATAIGNGAIVDSSNKVIIGNTAIISIGGQVGWTTYSDQHLKTNINKSKLGLDFIMALNPVTYNYKAEGQKDILYTGLIAQEVDEAAKKAGVPFSGVDKNGQYWGIRYGELAVPLIKAMQEMEEKYTAEKEILNSRIEKLEVAIANMNQTQKGNTIIPEKSFLFQNQPNPFNTSCTIHYILNDKNAVLVIRDMNGKALKNINLASGKGATTINAGGLPSGTYTYSLIINGECADTKLMVIAK